MNTAQLIPTQCVAPIVLRTNEHPDLPFFGGTGFFVHLPPYNEIYFVTARHCIFHEDGNPKGDVEVKLNNDPICTLAVPFCENLTVLESDGSPDFEDIVIFTVGELSEVAQTRLLDRSLRLPNQSIAELLQENLLATHGKVRTIGYPSTSKEIDYEKNHATVQPRGIVGTVTAKSEDAKWFIVEDLNWKEDSLSGFSGSPIIEFVPDIKENIVALPIGVLLTGAKNKMFRFLTINVVTNAISAWIIKTKFA